MKTAFMIPVIVAGSLSAGCADYASEDGSDEGEIAEVGLPVVADNGTELNGTNLNGIKLNGTKLNGTKLNGTKLNGTKLVGTLLSGIFESTSSQVSGLGFIGAMLDALLDTNENEQVRIDGIDATGIPGLSVYTVRFFDKTLFTWKSICGESSPGVPVQAIPIAGRWDNTTGIYTDDDTEMTFACRGAALAKCIEWGYKVWTVADECNGQNCQSRSLKDLHQACSRMVRADYCGDGVHHTANGTSINMWDIVDIQTKDIGTGMSFEAEWTANGAACVKHTRWANTAAGEGPDKAYILSHCPERWAGPSGTCGDSSSNFNVSKGFNTPTTVRRVLRNESFINLY